MWRRVRVTISHLHLNCRRAGNRIHDTGKFNQDSVARQLNHTALMLGNFRIDHFGSHRFKRIQRSRFVGPHHPGIADNVGNKNCR